MLYIGGLIFALLCVFGSFVASGGAIVPLVKSMPFELLTILGSAVGVFIMSNGMSAIKSVFGYLMLVIKGPKYKKDDYVDLLSLLDDILKKIKKGGINSIEDDFENPEESELFKKYPAIVANHKARNFICDYLRMISLNMDDPHEINEVMEQELKKNHHEEMHIAESLQGISDALPALGIVAAVLGVVKTMAAISKPPAVLGEMIAGALVGTFLGVLLAYGVVGPLASRMGGVVSIDSHYYNIIRLVIVVYLQEQPVPVCIEVGRKGIPEEYMPEFNELEEMIAAKK